MPVWESEKGLERKPLFRSLPSTLTGDWVSLLQSSPCHVPKNIRILKLWKHHRSASPITIYFKELKCYVYSISPATTLLSLPVSVLIRRAPSESISMASPERVSLKEVTLTGFPWIRALSLQASRMGWFPFS